MLADTNQRLPEPLPGDPLGQRLCQLFTHLWQAIVKPNVPDEPWKTLTKYPLTPRKLWNLWQDAAQVVGVRFSSREGTIYGLLDIDIESPYHPKQDAEALPKLRSALEEIGITRTFLIQSSWSGGLHLWIPLPERVPTFWFAAALKLSLEAHSFVLKTGALETFPNCKAYARSGTFTQFQGHRLPLQAGTGSFLLTDDLQPLSSNLSAFFEIWDICASAQDMQTLHQAIADAKIAYKGRQNRGQNQSQDVDQWRKELEREIGEGWTGYGQTNNLLKMIACYGVVFERLTGEALVEYMQRIATSRPGYLQWCRHQHELPRRCREWAKQAESYYWALGSEPKRQGNIHGYKEANEIVPFNQKRAQEAQERIRNAVLTLQTNDRLPAGTEARAQAIISIAHCSKTTLHKYLHLWHPEHYEGATGCTPTQTANLKASQTIDVEEPRSPKHLLAKDVHTYPLIKGLGNLTEEIPAVFLHFASWGGAGGLSPTASSSIGVEFNEPHLGRRKSKQSKGIGKGIDEETRVAIGRTVKQLGWKLEELKQFTLEKIGKVIQALTDEDGILLLYHLQNLISPP